MCLSYFIVIVIVTAQVLLLYDYLSQHSKHSVIQIMTTFVFHGGKLFGNYGRHPIELIIV